MRITKRICAALAALTMTAGLALADTFPPGAWLPITNILAQTGQPVTLAWDDFSDLVGLEVWTTETLDNPDWQPLSVMRGGETVSRFALNELGLIAPSMTPTRFYRLRGVRGDGSTIPVIPGVGDDSDSLYVRVDNDSTLGLVYIWIDSDGNAGSPPTFWININGDNGGPTQVWSDGEGGWSLTPIACLCASCGLKIINVGGDYYVQIFVDVTLGNVYIKTGSDGKVIMPPTFWININGTPTQVYPNGSGGWTTTPPSGGAQIIHIYGGNTYINIDIDITFGDIFIRIGDINGAVIPPTFWITIDGTPVQVYPDGNGGWTTTPPTGCVCGTCACSGSYPPGTGGGTDKNGTNYVFVVGPDGIGHTDDDVVIRPAGSADIHQPTGIVTVPGGSVLTTNGAPIIIGGVNDTLVPPGSFPPGTLVLPDGTIIVPANPANPGLPKINPDGTVDVGPGDIVIYPPYDAPYVVPVPGGKYDPSIPGVIIGGVIIPFPYTPYTPPTPAPDGSVDGGNNIIPGAALGDDSDWMPIASANGYYLIVRMKHLIDFGGTVNNFVTAPNVVLDGYNFSNVKQATENWWNGVTTGPNSHASFAAQTKAGLKAHIIKSNADQVCGTATMPTSNTDGMSAPNTGSYLQPFALSFTEVVNYLALSYYNGSTVYNTTTAYANSNWQALDSHGGNRYGALYIGSWLRSIGTQWSVKQHSILGWEGLVFGENPVSGGKPYYIRPAMWVSAAIFGGQPVAPVAMTGISVKTQPATMTYTVGQLLDLSGLVVTLAYDNSTTVDVPFANFGSYAINVSPLNGFALTVAAHNGQPVAVSCSGFNAYTANLTVTAGGGAPTVPGTPGQGSNEPNLVTGRTLTGAQTGDGIWIEIAQTAVGGKLYSLIVRKDNLPLQKYTEVVYTSMGATDTSKLRGYLNDWFKNGIPSVRLTQFTVQNTAMANLGTYGTYYTGGDNYGVFNGFSSPTGVKDNGQGATTDIVFPLSYGEAARLVSKQWALKTNESHDGTFYNAQASAIANFNQLVFSVGWDRSWLRSPGSADLNTATFLERSDGRPKNAYSQGSQYYGARPAAWVDSDIFNP